MHDSLPARMCSAIRTGHNGFASIGNGAELQSNDRELDAWIEENLSDGE